MKRETNEKQERQETMKAAYDYVGSPIERVDPNIQWWETKLHVRRIDISVLVGSSRGMKKPREI